MEYRACCGFALTDTIMNHTKSFASRLVALPRLAFAWWASVPSDQYWTMALWHATYRR